MERREERDVHGKAFTVQGKFYELKNANSYRKHRGIANESLQYHLVKFLPSVKLEFHHWIYVLCVVMKLVI